MTNPTTSLMGAQPDFYSIDRVKNMLTIAEQFHKAGCFTTDVQNTHQAYVKIQAGAEMGLTPMEAMSDLVLMKGNITFWGKGLVKRFRRFGWSIAYTEESENGVTVTVTNGEQKYTEKTLKKEVEKGFGYKADPKAKMRYHALARIARQYIPEILGSVNYIAEEIENVKEIKAEGGIIDAEPEVWRAEIDALKTGEELKKYWEKNKGKGKEFDFAIIERKKQIQEEKKEEPLPEIMPEPQTEKFYNDKKNENTL